MAKSSIEWTEHVWNPIRGCSRISEGCRNCYAERMAARFCRDTDYSPELGVSDPFRKADPFHGFAQMTPSGPRWTGRVELIPEMLDVPLRRKKPTTYFVNSMSDLFHEALGFTQINHVWQVMLDAPQHRYIVLTKRAKRMLDYFSAETVGGRAHYRNPPEWIILGVSCEDQAAADERIPHLLATPAACRMVSAEPLLGPIEIERYLDCLGQDCCQNCGDDAKSGLTHEEIEWTPGGDGICAECGELRSATGYNPVTGEYERLDWVIVGGESGPGARPMHPDWARSLRDQCVDAGVPFFFKQWGEWLPGTQYEQVHHDADPEDDSRFLCMDWDGEEYFHSPGQWMDEIDDAAVFRVGKKLAGRKLDGRVWDERPEVLR